jgi:hypothetical protein
MDQLTSVPGTPVPPPPLDQAAASGGLRDRLQALRDRLLASHNDARMPSIGEFGNQMGANADQVLPAPERVRGALNAGISYIPNAPLRDKLTAGVNSFEIPKSWSELPQYIRDSGGSSDWGGTLMQAAKGFNSGLEPYVRGALNATPTGAINTAARTVGFKQPFSDLGDAYHNIFVEGAPPITPAQKIMRAGGKSIGADAPLLLTGMGLAGAGVRSGVSLAEQALPGVLDKIRSVPVNGIMARLKNLVPDFINSLHPENVVKSFSSPNLQAAVDTILQKIAANPGTTAKLSAVNSLRRGVRPEIRRQAQDELARAGQEQQAQLAE